MPSALLRASVRTEMDAPFTWEGTTFSGDIIVDVPTDSVSWPKFLEHLITEVLESVKVFDKTNLKPIDLVSLTKISVIFSDGHVSGVLNDKNWAKHIRLVEVGKERLKVEIHQRKLTDLIVGDTDKKHAAEDSKAAPDKKNATEGAKPAPSKQSDTKLATALLDELSSHGWTAYCLYKQLLLVEMNALYRDHEARRAARHATHPRFVNDHYWRSITQEVERLMRQVIQLRKWLDVSGKDKTTAETSLEGYPPGRLEENARKILGDKAIKEHLRIAKEYSDPSWRTKLEDDWKAIMTRINFPRR